MKRSLLTWIAIGLAAASVAVEWHVTTTLSRAIAGAETRVAGLRRAAAIAAANTAEQKAAQHSAEDKWDVAAAEIAIEQRYGPGPAKVWRLRVEALQAAMAATPEGQIPELAFLQLKDWIDAAVRAEGASPEKLRNILTALREMAHFRVTEKIYDALKRFLAASDGVLPSDIQQLRPLLPLTITQKILAPYHVTSIGPAAKSDEHVIEAKFENSTLAITSTGWGWNADSWFAGEAESLAMIHGGDEASLDAWDAQRQKFGAVFGPMFEQALPDSMMDAFVPQLKTAVEAYTREHEGQVPRSVGDLQSSLPATATLAERLRPIMATLEYAMEHEGELQPDPSKLQRYVDALDDTHLLRRLRLTFDAEECHLNFDLN